MEERLKKYILLGIIGGIGSNIIAHDEIYFKVLIISFLVFLADEISLINKRILKK